MDNQMKSISENKTPNLGTFLTDVSSCVLVMGITSVFPSITKIADPYNIEVGIALIIFSFFIPLTIDDLFGGTLKRYGLFVKSLILLRVTAGIFAWLGLNFFL